LRSYSLEWSIGDIISSTQIAASHTLIGAIAQRAVVPRFRRAWNRWATADSSASSIPPAAFASPLRMFHDRCNVCSLNGGFSKGTTGSISSSRPPRGDSFH